MYIEKTARSPEGAVITVRSTRTPAGEFRLTAKMGRKARPVTVATVTTPRAAKSAVRRLTREIAFGDYTRMLRMHFVN